MKYLLFITKVGSSLIQVSFIRNILFIVSLLSLQNGFSQSFINVDIGNWVLLRPNFGYEYRWKNKAIGTNIRWQRNAHIWVTEMPGLMKTAGVNLDFTFRQFLNKYAYSEAGLRLTCFDAPFFVRGWHTSSLYNSDQKVEPFIKLGLNGNGNKRFQWDFGVGVGASFSTKNLNVHESGLMNDQYLPYTEIELKQLYKKPLGIETQWVPHAQLRLHYRIRE